MNSASHRGILLVISSPSGAGKTTLCRKLIEEFEQLTFSVSYTTRPARPNEIDGVDYHFVDNARFDHMVEDDQLAEWAHVHDYRYGTAKATIEQSLMQQRDLLFDIDWNGATQLKSKYPLETEMIFVLPPSLELLAKRLRRRGTDAPEVVERRLAKACEELGHFGEYNYLLLNDDLNNAYQQLRSIYLAAHCVPIRLSFRALQLLEEIRAGQEKSK